MKDVLTEEFVSEQGRPEVIVTDPPRAGMHPGVVQRLLAIAPGKIVYVSCNPATQARDLLILKDHYQVSRIQPIDMFPHTTHDENVILLEHQEGNYMEIQDSAGVRDPGEQQPKKRPEK